MLVDRSQEPKICHVCKSKYDTKKHQPSCLIPCGHTFCVKCILEFNGKKCVVCELAYNQHIPDYAMIDIVAELTKIKIPKDSSVNRNFS